MSIIVNTLAVIGGLCVTCFLAVLVIVASSRGQR